MHTQHATLPPDSTEGCCLAQQVQSNITSSKSSSSSKTSPFAAGQARLREDAEAVDGHTPTRSLLTADGTAALDPDSPQQSMASSHEAGSEPGHPSDAGPNGRVLPCCSACVGGNEGGEGGRLLVCVCGPPLPSLMVCVCVWIRGGKTAKCQPS